MVRGLFLWRYVMSGLNQRYLKAMAQRLEKAGWLFTAEPELPKEYVIEQAAECMGGEWQDKAAIVWTVDEVLTAAHPGDGPEWITKLEAANILCKAVNQHDSTQGITWDIIETLIQEFKNEKEKV